MIAKLVHITPISLQFMILIEGSLEAKLPTIWTDEKQRWEDKRRSSKIKKRKSQKKIQAREKVGKSRNTVLAGAEPAGQMRDEKLHTVVARSTFPSQNVQSTPHVRTTFGS